VHGQVDLTGEQRIAQGRDEDSGAADLVQRRAGGVAVSRDRNQLD
jgi:hypothetical protein